MKTMRDICLVVLVAVAACATQDAPKDCSKDGGAACFAVPTAPIAAYLADGTPETPSLGCGPLTAAAFARPVPMGGLATDLISNAPVPGMQFAVYASASLAAPVASATSDANGMYSLTLPAGSPNVVYFVASASGYIPTTVLRAEYDPSATSLDVPFQLATPDDGDLDAGLLRTTYDHADGIALMFASDCNRARLQHAAIVVSSESGKRSFVDGVVVANTADTALVPVLHSVQPDTSKLGVAGAVNLPVGVTLYAQAWGFPDAAALARGEAGLALLDELPFTADSGALVVDLYSH